MKFSWIFLLLLLVAMAIFSVQNAAAIPVHFLAWKIDISAGLIIQLAAVLGAIVGLVVGVWSRRRPKHPPLSTTDTIAAAPSKHESVSAVP